MKRRDTGHPLFWAGMLYLLVVLPWFVHFVVAACDWLGLLIRGALAR